MSEFTSPPDVLEYIRSLDQRIAALEAGPKGLWQLATLQNGWTNLGPSYEPAGFMQDDLGFVHLRGVIKGGETGSNAFTLPKGSRPGAQAWYSLVGGGFFRGVLQITTVGFVNIAYEGAEKVFGISGITFLVER